MAIRAFHGYITEEFLAKFQGRLDFSTIQGIKVFANPWMEAGREATFIVQDEDLDLFATYQNGRIQVRATCWILPGHLDVASWTAQEAAQWARDHLDFCHEGEAIVESLGQCPAPSRQKIEEIVEEVLKRM